MPGQTEIPYLRVKDSRFSATPKLRRLLWNDNRSDWSWHNLSKAGLDLLADSLGIDITCNYDEDVIRYISPAIVAQHIITRDPIEYAPQSDDWGTTRMQLIGRAKGEMAEHSIGIIVAHFKLAPDYVHLALQLPRVD
jgi:hypothetical protein